MSPGHNEHESPIHFFLNFLHRAVNPSCVCRSGIFRPGERCFSSLRNRLANRRLALRRAASADTPFRRAQWVNRKRRSPRSFSPDLLEVFRVASPSSASVSSMPMKTPSASAHSNPALDACCVILRARSRAGRPSGKSSSAEVRSAYFPSRSLTSLQTFVTSRAFFTLTVCTLALGG